MQFNQNMLCPACQTELVPGEDQRYQTLDEHVCCPNMRSPIRATVQCPNVDCKAHQVGAFWSFDGEGPYCAYGEDIKWIDHNPHPFWSWYRQQHFTIGYDHEDQKLRLGKLVIRREYRYRSDLYGRKTGMMTRHSFWYNNTLWTPGITMLVFVLGRFYRAKKTGGTWFTRETEGIIERADWPRAEWWRRSARWWVKTFHRGVYRRITEQEQ